MGFALRRSALVAVSTARPLTPRSALATLCLFALVVFAMPLQRRDTWTGMNSHDLWTEGCKPVIFIFCRETLAPGNMGFKVGPALSNSLKAYFGPANVATQGVDYLALPVTNLFTGGGPTYGIGKMQQLLTQATSLCPNSSVVAAGYSQGAAVTHRAIEFVPQEVRNKIVGVVTFGDTQTLQDNGRIIGYPVNRTLIICNRGDVICVGTLFVVPTHFNYMDRVPEAAAFLISRILIAYALSQGTAVPESTTESVPLTTFTTTLPPPPTFSSMSSSRLRPTTQLPPPRVTTGWPLRPTTKGPAPVARPTPTATVGD